MESVSDREWMLEKLHIYGEVLDIGAGPLTTLAAAQANVTCIDIDREALDAEKKNAEEAGLSARITFRLQNALDMPYADNQFDFCISYGALHHVDEDKREQMVDEMARVSRTLAIADFNENGFPHTPDEYTIVDFDWLEKKLGKLGRVKKFNTEQTILFVCNT